MRKIIFDIETDGLIINDGSKQIFPKIYVVSIYDSETDKYSSFTEAELKNLWPILEKADLLIGFNNIGFDTPVLNHYYSGDLSKIANIDILDEIKKSLGRRIKLDTVAEATLGRKKISHGLEAMTWWKQGLFEKVKEYCVEDVRITKDVYEYALKNGILKYKDKDTGQIKDIKLDTSKWEQKNDSAITHTLFG
jgi:DEAD/DEAH box helicase domain-containing protein